MFRVETIATAIASKGARPTTFHHTPKAASQTARFRAVHPQRGSERHDRNPARAIMGKLASVIANVERTLRHRKGNSSELARNCATVSSSSAYASPATEN